MMNTLKTYINFFRLSENDKLIIHDHMLYENIKRVFYLTLFAVPISLFHVFFFYLGAQNSEGVEHTWKMLIMFSHLFIVIFLSLVGGFLYVGCVRPKKISKIAPYLIHLTATVLIAAGIAISCFDQLVVSAINPYILSSILSAIILLIRPLYALIYYSVSYFVFYFSIAITQTNPDVLISNRVNGITIAGISLCLSFIFWRTYLHRIKQNKIIEQQNKELQENYNQLSFYSNELEESNTTKDKLFSVIAHDLRSPYSAMIGVTHILAEDIEIMSQAEIKKTMLVLKKEAEHSFDLLNNLLLWSKTQLKKFVPSGEEINIHQLTSKTFNVVESMSREKGISLVNEIDEVLFIIGDTPMIQSVLKNLLTNGIKFTSKGGTIIARASKNGKMVEVEIQDSGIGMEDEQKNNLFKLNNDSTTLGTENEEGTGLGLQICKEFVELNGGQIWVNSEIGKGSTFHFLIPSK